MQQDFVFSTNPTPPHMDEVAEEMMAIEAIYGEEHVARGVDNRISAWGTSLGLLRAGVHRRPDCVYQAAQPLRHLLFTCRENPV